MNQRPIPHENEYLFHPATGKKLPVRAYEPPEYGAVTMRFAARHSSLDIENFQKTIQAIARFTTELIHEAATVNGIDLKEKPAITSHVTEKLHDGRPYRLISVRLPLFHQLITQPTPERQRIVEDIMEMHFEGLQQEIQNAIRQNDERENATSQRLSKHRITPTSFNEPRKFSIN